MKWYCLLALFLIGSAVWGQTSATFRNRLAWRLENDKLRVTVLPGGGHIAELVLKNPPGGREVNPLWIPPWPSIEPSTYDRAKHGTIYGADSEGATLAGIMGHNLCFDYFGAPSGTEFAAGHSFHGEVSTLAWQQVNARNQGGSVDLTYRANLTRTSMTRTLRLRPGQPVLYFEETAENLTTFDMPIGWIQHVTFGPPFVDARHSSFNASATRGERQLGTQRVEFEWPRATAAPEKDFRRFSTDDRSSDMAFTLLDPKRDIEFISGLNTEFRVLVVYIFKRQDFPWLAIWEQNRDRMQPPWNGESRTRGMEFGNTRIGGTLKAYLQNPRQWDTTTFGWLDAKEKKTARYMAVSVPIPEGFDSLVDAMIAGSEILLIGPRNQTIKVPFDPALF
jgi:hypothetical protein